MKPLPWCGLCVEAGRGSTSGSLPGRGGSGGGRSGLRWGLDTVESLESLGAEVDLVRRAGAGGGQERSWAGPAEKPSHRTRPASRGPCLRRLDMLDILDMISVSASTQPRRQADAYTETRIESSDVCCVTASFLCTQLMPNRLRTHILVRQRFPTDTDLRPTQVSERHRSPTDTGL